MKILIRPGMITMLFMPSIYNLSLSLTLSGIFRLAILGELLNCIDSGVGLINLGNIQEILTTISDLVHDVTQSNELKNIRRVLQIVFKQRAAFLEQKSIVESFGVKDCQKLMQYLLSDTNTCPEIIAEKQILLQLLMANKLMTVDECTKLLNLFMSNTIYKRPETINTVKCMLENAKKLGFQKTSEVMVSCFHWLYSEINRNQGQNIIFNLKPIEPDVIAETCALAMINILSDAGFPKNDDDDDDQTKVVTTKDRHYQLFLYKFNRKYICLETAKSYLSSSLRDEPKKESGFQEFFECDANKPKTCLFQSNYEYVMRLLELKISQSTSIDTLLKSLESLRKLSGLMKYLLYYEIFDEKTYTQCPLIKRIGLFLNHIKVWR